MQDRRNFGDPGQKPLYRLSEILALIGGRGSPKAQSAVRKDIRALATMGLVKISKHQITFASSPEQIAVADLSSFWDMWSLIPNKRRRVPVPRRTLRALAAGFSKATTGVMLGMLIRSVFVHRKTGDLRLDGRTKRSWICEVFSLPPRSVSEARAHLTQLGWLVPLETTQRLLSRFGAHDQVNVDWKPENEAKAHGGGGERSASGVTQSAAPSPQKSTQSAAPIKNRTPLPNGREIETRTLGGEPPDPAGFSNSNSEGRKKASLGLRKARRRKERAPNSAPVLQDVRAEDLRSTDALLELHRQAIEKGLANGSVGGRLDFLAFAERARSRADKPAAMFMWLLKGNHKAFITLADEDAAAARLREHFNGPDPRKKQAHDKNFGVIGHAFGGGGEGSGPPPELTEEERLVQACIQVSRQHRGLEPAVIARKAKGWTKERWDSEYLAYRASQTKRQMLAEDDDVDSFTF